MASNVKWWDLPSELLGTPTLKSRLSFNRQRERDMVSRFWSAVQRLLRSRTLSCYCDQRKFDCYLLRIQRKR